MCLMRAQISSWDGALLVAHWDMPCCQLLKVINQGAVCGNAALCCHYCSSLFSIQTILAYTVMLLRLLLIVIILSILIQCVTVTYYVVEILLYTI